MQSSFQMALPNAVLGESKDSGVEENHSLAKVEDTKGFVTDANKAVEGATESSASEEIFSEESGSQEEESETNAPKAETNAPDAETDKKEHQNVEDASVESQTDDENTKVENENQEEDTENQHTESPDTESQDTDNQNQDSENQDTDNQNTEFSVTEDLKKQAFQLEEIANKRLKYAKELLENLEFEYNFKARDLKEELEHYRGAKGKNPFETMRLADEIDLVLRDYTNKEEFEQYKQQFYERFYDGVMESYSSHEDTINGRVAPLPTRKTCELDYVNKSVSCVL